MIFVPIRVDDGLPFVEVTLRIRGQQLHLQHVVIDTGSAASVFSADDLEAFGIFTEPTDKILMMRGIGGEEPVVETSIEAVEVGPLVASPFTIQIGGLNYGFQIEGILGLDFLLHTQAIIDLKSMQLRSSL